MEFKEYGSILLTPITGNVGIATTNPTQKIDVNGDAIIRDTLSLVKGNQGTIFTNNQMLFGYDGIEQYRHSIKTRHQGGTQHNQNSIDFYLWKNGQNANDVGSTHGMSITAGGVGIGKTDPSYPLDVNGDISCSGTYRQNGTSGYLVTKGSITTYVINPSSTGTFYLSNYPELNNLPDGFCSYMVSAVDNNGSHYSCGTLYKRSGEFLRVNEQFAWLVESYQDGVGFGIKNWDAVSHFYNIKITNMCDI